MVCAALLGACAAHRADPPPSSLDRAHTRAPSTAADSSHTDDLALAPALQQAGERDYTVGGMFNERHGETLQKARGFKPNVVITGYYQPNQEFRDSPGKWSTHELHSDFLWETPVDPDSWFSAGLHGWMRDFQFDTLPTGAHSNEKVYELGLVLGGGHFLDDRTFVEFTFEPGIYSDLDGTLTERDWQFFGQVHGTWRYDEHVFFKGGFRVDNTFDDLPIYPQAGVMVQMHEQWRFDTLLPNYLKVQWNPNAEFLVDVGIRIRGQDYTIRESAAFGKGTYDWRTQDLQLFMGAAYRLSDEFAVLGSFGGTVAGDYEFNGSGGSTTGTPAGSMFFEVGLGLNW